MKKYMLLAVSAVSMTALTGCFHGHDFHRHGRAAHEKTEAHRAAYDAEALPPHAHEGEGRPQCHKATHGECERKCHKDRFDASGKERCTRRCHEKCEKNKRDCKENKRDVRKSNVDAIKNAPYYEGFCPPGEATRGRC
ncbi:MAG: hypothetical protein ABW189_08130 [Rickettsiales bacterium]